MSLVNFEPYINNGPPEKQLGKFELLPKLLGNKWKEKNENRKLIT